MKKLQQETNSPLWLKTKVAVYILNEYWEEQKQQQQKWHKTANQIAIR